jgi:hypothetical protein
VKHIVRASHRFAEMYSWLLRWIGFTSFTLALFYFAATAHADARSASVMIKNGNNSFSGTILNPTEDGRTFVATCAHGFAGRIGGPCRVFLDGKEIAGTLRFHDTSHDVAIVEIPSGEYPSVELAGGSSPAGTSIESFGFPGGTGPTKFTSRIVDNNFVHRCTVHNNGAAYVTVADQVKQGHSGGGLFIDGKLAGVVSATDGSRTLFCLPDALHKAYHSVATGVVSTATNVICPPGRG